MSIDTLNAYCGPWLVHCPCLAQGRLLILLPKVFHEIFGSIGLLFREGLFYASFPWPRGAWCCESVTFRWSATRWTLGRGSVFPGSVMPTSCRLVFLLLWPADEEEVVFFLSAHPYCFDLRAGKVTRQI